MKPGRIVGILAGVLVLTPAAALPQAQAPPPRLEVGAQASLLHLTDADFDATNAGIGGRIGVDVSRWLAIDGAATFYPSDNITQAMAPAIASDLRIVNHRRRAEAFAGVRVGTRWNRLGAFAKVRPGVTRLFDRGTECLGADCARVLMLLAIPEYRAEFALDLGGGVEFHPSGRAVARVEFGDTLIRHRSSAPPCPAGGCTSHNLSTRVGLGWKF